MGARRKGTGRSVSRFLPCDNTFDDRSLNITSVTDVLLQRKTRTMDDKHTTLGLSAAALAIMTLLFMQGLSVSGQGVIGLEGECPLKNGTVIDFTDTSIVDVVGACDTEVVNCLECVCAIGTLMVKDALEQGVINQTDIFNPEFTGDFISCALPLVEQITEAGVPSTSLLAITNCELDALVLEVPLCFADTLALNVTVPPDTV